MERLLRGHFNSLDWRKLGRSSISILTTSQSGAHHS